LGRNADHHLPGRRRRAVQNEVSHARLLMDSGLLRGTCGVRCAKAQRMNSVTLRLEFLNSSDALIVSLCGPALSFATPTVRVKFGLPGFANCLPSSLTRSSRARRP